MNNRTYQAEHLQSLIDAIVGSLLSKQMHIRSAFTLTVATPEGQNLVISVKKDDGFGELLRKPSGHLDEQQLSRIAEVMDKKIEEPLPVSMLASVAGLSRSQFSHAFRRTVGRSPHAHIVHLRLERAMKLMLESDDSLSEIALATGFTDQAHFSNRFRRAVGTTPAQWRKARRKARSQASGEGTGLSRIA